MYVYQRTEPQLWTVGFYDRVGRWWPTSDHGSREEAAECVAKLSTGGNMYVYIESEPGLWTVGFYDPSGKWFTDSDHATMGEAGARTAWLNGCS